MACEGWALDVVDLGGRRVGRFWVRGGVVGRLRGLLGTGDDADPIALLGCGSIHTHGMRYSIDVAFVSGDGRVLLAARGVLPGNVVSCPGARTMLERPSRDGWWPVVGDVVELRLLRGSRVGGSVPLACPESCGRE